jgi:SAM-dependent methyltransferase
VLTTLIKANKSLSVKAAERYPWLQKGANCHDELLKLIQCSLQSSNAAECLEIGGIDRPLLSKREVKRYAGLDIEFKPGCKEIYDEFYIQSIEDPVAGRYDFVISMTVLEHVPNNAAALQNIFDCLKPAGKTLHYLPSKYHCYSLILRVLGPKLQKTLIRVLFPEAANISGYPAFFSYCSPRAMRRLLKQIGFENIHISPFFRATHYFSFCFPVFLVVACWENFCSWMKWESLASGFIITAEKPGAARHP